MAVGLQNVNLMGPNPAQPMDLQARQAQLALQQAIAQGLVAQSMSPNEMLDTGLVKSANWGDALGKLAQAYFGHEGLTKVGEQQQELADAIINRRRAEIQAAMANRMPSGQPSDMGAPPTLRQIATSLMMGTDPNNIAAGGGLLNEMAKAAAGAQVKASDIVGATRFNLPSSIPAALGPDPLGLGFQTFAHPENLQLKPEIVKTEPEQAVNQVIPGGTTTQAVPPTPLPTRIVDQGEHYPGTNVKNPNPQQMAVTQRGIPEPVAGAQATAATETVKEKVRQAQDSQELLADRRTMIGQMVSMAKIAQYAADHGGNFGVGGPIWTEIRKWAAQAGLSSDQTNKITDYEYFIKNAVPQAAKNAREGVGARVPVVEYQGFTNALGAGGTTDPRAMVRITQDSLLNAINAFQVHKDVVLPSLASAAGKTEAFKAPALDISKDIMIPLQKSGVPINWQQDSSGYWSNPISPGTGAPAPAMLNIGKGQQQLPPGFSIEPE